ncbi:putative baseplate assembly protein [Massilia sp. W12]|uniref:putative baseplate assembly protein n=1 Tax=Massilia sp. W12 TaxID=3126507 RepID=UPI0030D3B343
MTSCTCHSTPCACSAPAAAPLPLRNRPGLPALRYRCGDYASFMQAMLARAPQQSVTLENNGQPQYVRPLQGLHTQSLEDPAIALMDAWACAADVLSFYQERIANEAFLRTAQERRSVLEMARLVGYRLRPGVAASVYLAFTLDPEQTEPALIARGSRVQSVPGPDELPQTFETAEDLPARSEWNALRARSSRPQRVALDTVLSLDHVWLQGAQLNLRPGQYLLFDFGAEYALRIVAAVQADNANARTRVELQALQFTLDAEPARHPLWHSGFVSSLQQFYAQPQVQSLLRAKQENAPAWNALSADEQRVLNDVQTAMRNAWRMQYEALRTIANKANSCLADLDGDESLRGRWVEDLFDIYLSTFDAALRQPLLHFADALENWWRMAPQMHPLQISELLQGLLQAPVPQAGNSQQLRRDLGRSFAAGADTHPQLLFEIAPGLRADFYRAWQGAQLERSSAPLQALYVMRAEHSMLGAQSPIPPKYSPGNPPVLSAQKDWTDWDSLPADEVGDALWLGQENQHLQPGQALLLLPMRGEPSNPVFYVRDVGFSNRSAFGVSAKCTRLQLDRTAWDPRKSISPTAGNDVGGVQGADSIGFVRSARILAQPEALQLAPAPLTDAVPAPAQPDQIELDGLYKELPSGRWVILEGERADIQGVRGVRAAELLMIASLRHSYDPSVPGDSLHTTLVFATPCAYRYKRDSLVLHANVARATHGETRRETLGSGNAAHSLQQFNLKQLPLTFTPAANAQGVDSSLQVLVNRIAWRETPNLAHEDGRSRAYMLQIDDDGATRICFGDGVNGARLPGGVENVQAEYRQGIGAAGNVRAEQISLLLSHPLGVQAVRNPLRAEGGADAESRDEARANLPLASQALTRLVSLRDYANFARSFAGIGKALARKSSDGRREVLQLTLAGARDAPLSQDADLLRALRSAMRELGDPDLPLHLDIRELIVLVLQAGLALQAGYQWEDVEARARAALLQTFSFAARDLNQPALLCEVLAALQNVAGVAWVRIENFGGVPEKITQRDGSRALPDLQELARRLRDIAQQGKGFDSRQRPAVLPQAVHAALLAEGQPAAPLSPAWLALFAAGLPETLILNQIL